jgi:hypothetical protein
VTPSPPRRVDPVSLPPDPVELMPEPPLPAPALAELIGEASTDLGADPPAEERHDGPMTAAQARLGSEGLSRLRARHAEVLARISEKVTDPVRRDELNGDAERLNPDTWVTDAEVSAGLEAYETVFETLRAVVGRRRKRRRGQGASATGSGGEPAPSGDQPDSADGADERAAADEDT